ncbi:hypothetical protein PIB30_079604 [Stylosanthes scabra]|uniref:Uncharacterized protein n=1 Tax=Stylosanthes scabra TaxID=79078 RepID=A0ABU6RRX7_9FABA|nr:hypothetical protein [Stylosanthes scabra]
MSSCDDYLGINPSMVHSCQMSWTPSKAAMFPEHVINNVPQVLRPNHGEDPVTDNSAIIRQKPHRQKEQDDHLVPRGSFPNLGLKASGTTPSTCNSHLMASGTTPSPCSSHHLASGTTPSPCVPNYFSATKSL